MPTKVGTGSPDLGRINVSGMLALSIIVLMIAPGILQMYVQRLPVAPACPSCRATTRELHLGRDLLRVVPLLTTTTRGECTRCGWTGRMRWKWAARRVRGD